MVRSLAFVMMLAAVSAGARASDGKLPELHWGVHLGGTIFEGAEGGVSWDLALGLRASAEDVAMATTLRAALPTGSRRTNAEEMGVSWSLDVLYCAGEKGLSPFIGGGFFVSWLSLHTRAVGGDATLMGFSLEAGLEVYRARAVSLALELRVDLPFLWPARHQTGNPAEAFGRYIVPISLGFTFSQ